jgi:hypothetical protein
MINDVLETGFTIVITLKYHRNWESRIKVVASTEGVQKAKIMKTRRRKERQTIPRSGKRQKSK